MLKNSMNNWWEHPNEDPRFQGLLDISRGISDVFDLASGQAGILEEGEFNPELYSFPTPLRLAEAMERGARRIREWTEGGQP